MGIQLTVTGLILNAIASILVIFPYIKKHNVDDDYIVSLNRKTGDFKQRKHIIEQKYGICGFLLFALGFIFQIVGILLK